MPFYRSVCDHKTVGYFQLICNHLRYFEINWFLKLKVSEFIKFAVAFFVLFCLNVTEPNNLLVHIFSRDVQIILV